MHMSDALISPAVGGAMWCASTALIAAASSKVRRGSDAPSVPMMGVMGAFVFAAQMINFSIPGTGSSGHLGGGILLAAVLGPWAGLLTVASVLVVQAVLFADGGLLALGCNVFNMGVLPCLVAFPLVARPWMGGEASSRRTAFAVAAAAVAALQLGAFAVVVETWASGVSALPFDRFVWLMQPIHLAIGIVEGLATAAIVLALRRSDSLGEWPAADFGKKAAIAPRRRSLRLGALALAALLTGGALSWFASGSPDGLEWAVEKTAPDATLEESPTPIHRKFSSAQEATAWMPDYDFRSENAQGGGQGSEEAWPNVHVGTSLAGIAGGALVAALLIFLGLALRPRRENAPSEAAPESE